VWKGKGYSLWRKDGSVNKREVFEGLLELKTNLGWEVTGDAAQQRFSGVKKSC